MNRKVATESEHHVAALRPRRSTTQNGVFALTGKGKEKANSEWRLAAVIRFRPHGLLGAEGQEGVLPAAEHVHPHPYAGKAKVREKKKKLSQLPNFEWFELLFFLFLFPCVCACASLSGEGTDMTTL